MEDFNPIHHRFVGSSYYEKSQYEQILIAGLGGIGSNTAYNLCKSVPANYIFIDDDKVEIHNIGTQFFFTNQEGKNKVEAIKDTLYSAGVRNISVLPRRIITGDALPISIAAFDNMDARKQLFEDWKSYEDRELFIDGRLRASYYEIYAVTKGTEEDYEKTLFDSSEAVPTECTFKQTTYFGCLIGAKIAQIIINYLMNKYSDFQIAKVPFCVKEIGDLYKTELIWIGNY